MIPNMLNVLCLLLRKRHFTRCYIGPRAVLLPLLSLCLSYACFYGAEYYVRGVVQLFLVYFLFCLFFVLFYDVPFAVQIRGIMR